MRPACGDAACRSYRPGCCDVPNRYNPPPPRPLFCAGPSEGSIPQERTPRLCRASWGRGCGVARMHHVCACISCLGTAAKVRACRVLQYASSMQV